jgi:AcrR family transcriptional regulator
MARPENRGQKRRELLPIVARAFSELGYRRTTTAELARRCRVQENILYRLWPDKKAMFVAAIGYIYDHVVRTWTLRGMRPGGSFSPADAFEYESEHLGEFGHHRIVFAGLSESDDPEIRAALGGMYRDMHRFIRESLASSAEGAGAAAAIDPALAAWALIGVGTIVTIGKEIGLLGARTRARLLREAGGLLLASARRGG